MISHRVRVIAGIALALALVPSPAYAHSGHCSAPETATTFVFAFGAGMVIIRPWRKAMAHRARFSAAVLPVILAGALAFTACGGAKTAASGKRPSTTARLQIVQPAASATVPSPVHVVLNVTGGTIAPPTETKLAANRGHIHLSVDKKLVSMNYSTEQDLPGLAPGLHTLEAEFVAADHAPFSNRVIAAVIFRVQ